MLELSGVVSEVVVNPAGKTRKGIEFPETATVQIIGRTVAFGVQKGAMFDVRCEPDERAPFEKLLGKRIRIWVDLYNDRIAYVSGSPINELAK